MLDNPEQNNLNTQSVSDLLRSIPSEQLSDHPVADYIRAMAEFPQQAHVLLHIGRDTVSISLDNGNVLKLSARDLPLEFGTRSFDVPIISRGKTFVGKVAINHFIQPKGEPVSDFQYETFLKELASKYYWMCDPGKRNLVFLPDEKRVALVDPWAVEKIQKRLSN